MVVEPRALEDLPTLVEAYNEPFADPSALPTYHVARMTRRHVTVALSGDGGDEAFAGYRRYAVDRFLSWYLRLPAFLREKVLRRVVEGLPGSGRPRGFISQLKRFVSSVDPVRERQYVRYLCYFTEEMKDQVYTPEFHDSMSGQDSVTWWRTSTAPPTGRTFSTGPSSSTPIPICLTISSSRSTSPAWPIPWKRVHPFWTTAWWSSPPPVRRNSSFAGWKGKYLVKEAFRRHLPREVTARKKMGFGMPVAEWFRGELREPARDILLENRTLQRGYFSDEGVRRLLEEHQGLKRDHGYRLWALLFPGTLVPPLRRWGSG